MSKIVQLHGANGEKVYPVVPTNSLDGILAVEKGGTGADNVVDARENLGIKIVSEDEYDNLATKDAPVYFCYNDSDEEGFNYSAEEQIVGTWIDGKPLYQRTCTFTTSQITLPFEGYDYITTTNFALKVSSSSTTYLFTSSYANSSSNLAAIYIRPTDNIFTVQLSGYTFNNIVVTFQYTKLND